MDSWDDLRFFLAAHRERHVGRAAKHLRVHPSTVSRRLAALETRLGERLFVRTPDGLAPTQAAAPLRAVAERMERALASFEPSPALEGVVTIATPPGISSYLIQADLEPLLRAHPGLDLELLVGRTYVDLLRREADLAIRFFRTDHDALRSRHLASFPYAILGHPDYLAARADMPLQALDWVGWERGFATDPTAAWMHTHGITPRVRASSVLTQWALVESGFGVALMPRIAALRAMATLDAPDELPQLDVFLTRHHATRDIARVNVVADWIVERFAQTS